jgi:AcrR family transcriptional regulator
VAATHGLARLSVGDVARRAGLSRQTLYKHFASREELITRAVVRETGRLVEQVIAAAEPIEDPVASLEVAIATALRLVRGHPLLDRLIATEPEALLPLLIDAPGTVQGAVGAIARRMLEDRLPDVAPAAIAGGADVLSRMLLSYAVRPPDQPVEQVAAFLAAAIAGGVASSPPA